MRRSIMILSAALTLTIPAVALAEAPEPITFVRKGVEYTYTVTQDGNNRVLTGTARHGTVPFRLRVAGTRVTGTYNDQPVEFTLKDVEREMGSTEVAAR